MNLTTIAKGAVIAIATAGALLFGAQAASADSNPWDGTVAVAGETNPWDGIGSNPWDGAPTADATNPWD